LVRAFEQKDADIAWLLDEVDALRERVAILRAEVADLEDMADVRGGDA
jgi:ubiquinone biosynthesis protein UbiJ